MDVGNRLNQRWDCLQYDKNHSGALEFEELHAVLADLGILVLPFILQYSVSPVTATCYASYIERLARKWASLDKN